MLLMDPPSPDNYIDLETLLEALPACKHCRERRRRCDTKLPSCENCAKTGRECIYYDSVLKEELPRTYIASLVQHLREGQTTETRKPKRFRLESSSQPVDAAENSQHSFAFAQGAYRYLGAPSPLLSDESRHGTAQEAPKRKRVSPSPPFEIASGAITPAWHRYLVEVFFDTINQVYTVLDPSMPWLSPDSIMESESSPAQDFMRRMVYSIACYCSDERLSSLQPLAAASHSRALELIGNATAEQSTSTLQVAILLVLHTLFDPAKGNISQQLGFAIRLTMDLAGSDSSDSDEESVLPRTLHNIVYCLENQVCNVLVRPTSLSEPSMPLNFSTEQPLDFLCTLARLQSRIRHRTLDDSLKKMVMSLKNEMVQRMHPNIVSALWETRLMMESSMEVALGLITAYNTNGYIATFLSTHWVHKAANIIIDGMSTWEDGLRLDPILAYGTATALLGKWSNMWEAANILLKDLESRNPDTLKS